MNRIGAFLLGVALVMLPMGYWAMDREPPFELKKAEVLTERVIPGGYVTYRVHARRFRSCPVTIETKVYDGEGKRWELPDQSNLGQSVLGDVPPYLASTLIPADAAPGKGRIEVLLAYRCNVTHHWNPIVVRGSQIEFTITDP